MKVVVVNINYHRAESRSSQSSQPLLTGGLLYKMAFGTIRSL